MGPLGQSALVRTASALAGSVCLTASLAAQATAPLPSSAGPAPVGDIGRIKRTLEQPSSGLREASTKTYDVTAATFRTNVTEKKFNIWEFWGDPETIVAPYVRPVYSETHYEFLRMVTPEYGRRAALYPFGMSATGTGDFFKSLFQARAARKAKQEVRDALEAFFKEHPEARVPPPAPPADAKPVP